MSYVSAVARLKLDGRVPARPFDESIMADTLETPLQVMPHQEHGCTDVSQLVDVVHPGRAVVALVDTKSSTRAGLSARSQPLYVVVAPVMQLLIHDAPETGYAAATAPGTAVSWLLDSSRFDDCTRGDRDDNDNGAVPKSWLEDRSKCLVQPRT